MLTATELFKNLYEANRKQAPGRSQTYKRNQDYKWGRDCYPDACELF